MHNISFLGVNEAVHTARGEESNNELAVSLQHDIYSPQPAHSFWMFLQTHLSRA